MSHAQEETYTGPPALTNELQKFVHVMEKFDMEQMVQRWQLSQPLFAQRKKIIADIPNFWAVVLRRAARMHRIPVKQHDKLIFQNCLTDFEVERPEILALAKPTDEDMASKYYTLTFKFHFKPNDYFHNRVLAKTFYYSYETDSLAGLVSEPVKVNWKSDDKDVTKGLTDAAYALWQAQVANLDQKLAEVLTCEAGKARDAAAKELPEYKTLARLIEKEKTGTNSFFDFFSYRGRWTSAAKDAQVRTERAAKHAAGTLHGPVEEDDFFNEDVETFPHCDVAFSLADDVFPNAIDYFLDDDMDKDILIHMPGVRRVY